MPEFRQRIEVVEPEFFDAIGIESPGLTAAGAIALRVTELLAGL